MQLHGEAHEEPNHVATERFYDLTGPGTPAGRYLRRFWIPVALLDDVAPGRAKIVQIMSEYYTYYRGETGAPHLLAQECAHRHASLAPTGIVDGDCISCFYHGWKYDATGQCVDQPAEGPENFASKVRIRSYPLREYLGFVFAYLGDGEPPAFQEIELFNGAGVREISSYTRKSNFFNTLDNQADWIHANFVHARSEFTKIGINREIPVVTAEETDFGVTGYLRYSDGVVGVNYVLMPLAMYIIGSGTRVEGHEGTVFMHQMAWRVPIDDDSHRSFNVHYAEITGEPAERFRANRRAARSSSAGTPTREQMIAAIFRGEIHVNEIDERRPDIVGIQDTVTMELQRRISDREPDRLGRSDAAVIVLRRIYMREIRNMLAGEPLKTWAWPRDLRAAPQLPAVSSRAVARSEDRP